MIKKAALVLFYFLYIQSGVFAQKETLRQSTKDYIERYKYLAVKEMLSGGVPASITLAQGSLESNDGKSPLAVIANNHFGVKCQGVWEGATFRYDDDAKNECFRKYKSVYESYHDHTDFLKTRSRYATLFNLDRTDYKDWAKGLKAAGYATNPKYPEMLIKLIEDYELHQYDLLTKVPNAETVAATHVKNNHIEPAQLKTVPVSSVRKVETMNGVKFIRAQHGDTFFRIAHDLDMRMGQILKYNDLNENDSLKDGDIIYLQPKKRKAEENTHLVLKGENMRVISQKFGVKLKLLYKKNNMIPGTEPAAGSTLKLR